MYGEGGSLDEFLSAFVALVRSVVQSQLGVVKREDNLKPECIRSGQGEWLDLSERETYHAVQDRISWQRFSGTSRKQSHALMEEVGRLVVVL